MAGHPTWPMSQGKVTKLISVAGDPHTILLSLDGRFLYVTQPGLGQVTVILAETGQPVCIARLPGKPAFLALDQYSNILYVAGSGAARVTALDPTTCAVQHVFQVESPVYGLAVAVVATGSSVNHQLWVAGMDATCQYFYSKWPPVSLSSTWRDGLRHNTARDC